jgi:hypothetical protein
MRTTEEAVRFVSCRIDSRDDPAFQASLDEVLADPTVLNLAMTLLDTSVGPAHKVLFALSIGILIGIEQERNSSR